MPLSDHEQRMLDQIESALYAEDPKFASSVRGGTLRAPSTRRRLQGAALFVIGLAMLVAGIAIPATRIVLDGDAVAPCPEGLPDFHGFLIPGTAHAPVRAFERARHIILDGSHHQRSPVTINAFGCPANQNRAHTT